MAPEATTEPGTLHWRVHLGGSAPGKVLLVFGAAGGVAAIGVVLMHSILFAVIGIVMVLAPTSEFLLPVRYSISKDGANSKWGLNSNFLAWEDVKQVRWGEQGVKLSPLPGPSRLEAFRGVYLRFAGNKQEVEDAVRYWYRSNETLG